jgi:uncharacterized membrane protein HdeD (DUF308 family)
VIEQTEPKTADGAGIDPALALRRKALAVIGAHWKLFFLQGAIMVALGVFAVLLPTFASLEFELLLGWMFIVGGFVRASMIFRKPLMPGRWWSILSSVLAVAIGGLLVARPLEGIMSLTVLLTALFAFEGVAAVLVAFEFRRYLRSWIWTLASGLVNLILACLIWQGWPNSARWVIGLFVGVNMIFLGLPLLTTAVAARKLGTDGQ